MNAGISSTEQTLQTIAQGLPSAPWNAIACNAGGQAATWSEADICSLKTGLSPAEMEEGYERSLKIVQGESVARAVQCGAYYFALTNGAGADGEHRSLAELTCAYRVGAALRQLSLYARQMTENAEHQGFADMIADMSSRVALPADLDAAKAMKALSDLGFAPRGKASFENLEGLIKRAKAKGAVLTPCAL